MVRSGLLLLFLAQTVRPQVTGTIAGRVTDALTHQPIHRALVIAPNGSRDVTGNDGSYTVKDVPPGDIPLRIGAEGYRLIDATEPIRIEPGGILNRDFELHPMARLSGRIVDRDTGEPLARRVLIEQKRTAPGGRGGGGIAVANQNGEFEIAGLEPGDYTATIDSLNDFVLVPNPAGKPEKPRKAYGTVWYPGVASVDMTTAIHLNEGERRRIEIRLSAIESHSAAGAIEAPSGHDGEALSIRLRPNGPATPLPPPGQFRFDGLTPGPFAIEAFVGSGANAAYGRTEIDIADRDLDGLTVRLLPSVTVNVKVRMAEDGVPLPSKLQFVLAPASNWPPMRPQERSAGSQFRLEGIAQDDYWPTFFGLPPGFAVSRTLFEDVELTSQPLALRSSGELTFVLTSKPGAIAGTVRYKDQAPVSQATVVLVPDSFTEHDGPGLYRAIEPGPGGAFSFPNLAPGKYRIIVLTGAGRALERPVLGTPSGVWSRFQFARLPHSELVEVKPLQTVNVSLQP